MIRTGRFSALTAAVLAAALTFSGCGRADTEAEIEKTVSDFLTYAISLDIDGALACIDEDSDYYAECSENGPLGLNADSSELSAVLGQDAELLGDDSGVFLDGVIDITRRHSSFTVDEVELISKSEAKAKATLSLPDFESVDAGSLVNAEDLPFDINDFLTYAAEKGYDSDAFLALDQEAGEELIYEYMRGSGYIGGVIDAVLKAMDENVAVEPSSAEFSLKLTKDGWKITGEEPAAESE